MKIKKILAAVAAAAVAVSTMAINSFAAITNADGGNYVYDVMANGYNVTDIYGVSFTISDFDATQGIGGGVGANSPSTGWESHDWANQGKEITLDGNTVTLKKDTPIFKDTDVTDPTNPYAQLWIQAWWGSDITVDNVVVLDKDGNALASSAAAPADTEATTATAEEDKTEADAAAAEDDTAAVAEGEADVADEDAADVEETTDEAADADVEETTDETTEDAADTTTEDVAAPAADAGTTEAAATGNVAVASIAAVMAVAGAAAIAAKKRK